MRLPMLFFFCPCRQCSFTHLDWNEDYIPRPKVAFDIADFACPEDNFPDVAMVAFTIHDTAYQMPERIALSGNGLDHIAVNRAAIIIRRSNAADCQQNEQYFLHLCSPPSQGSTKIPISILAFLSSSSS